MNDRELIQTAQEILSLADRDPRFTALADSAADLIDALATPGMREVKEAYQKTSAEGDYSSGNKPDEGQSEPEARAERE